MTQPATKSFLGTDFEPGAVWVVDPAHSNAEFVVRHLMSKVRGRFGNFDATVTLGDSIEDVRVEGSADVTSINTNQEYRDTHLRSADFFDVDKHPQLTFASTSIESAGDSRWNLRGDLTIRDVTRPVTFTVEVLGSMVDPQGNTKVGFNAEAEIDRYEFGLTWNQGLEAGNLLVAKAVKLEISGQLNRKG